MEFFSALKSENHKVIFTQLLPGTISLWPLSILFYKTFLFQIELQSEWHFIFLIILYLMISFGLAYLIEDIGNRIELSIERKLFKKGKLNKEEFNSVWKSYLQMKIEEVQPRIVKYNSGMVIRFKFELNMIVALSFMLISHLALQFFIPVKIDLIKTFVYVCFILLIVFYLLFETFTSVIVLHENRKWIVETKS